MAPVDAPLMEFLSFSGAYRCLSLFEQHTCSAWCRCAWYAGSALHLFATCAYTRVGSPVLRVCNVGKVHTLYQSGPPCYCDLGSICNLTSPEAAALEQGGALPCVHTPPPAGRTKHFT